MPLATMMVRRFANPVVAGEACTELGCESRPSAPVSWIERLFGTSKGASRTR